MPHLKNGFTLIELLVVISIIAIMSIVAFVNFKDFNAGQIAPRAAGQVQSYLRLAQSNATTSTVCNGSASTSWSLKLNSSAVELHCFNTADQLIRTYNLQNAQIQAIECAGGTPLSFPTTFTYETRSGKLTTSCSTLTEKIVFKIINASNPSVAPKTFKVSKGGAVDVE